MIVKLFLSNQSNQDGEVDSVVGSALSATVIGGGNGITSCSNSGQEIDMTLSVLPLPGYG